MWIHLRNILLAQSFLVISLTLSTFRFWPEMIMYPWLIQEGFVMHRDWLTVYTPIGPYFLHLLFSIVGYSISSLQVISIGFNIVNITLVYITSFVLFRKAITATLTTFFYALWVVPLQGNTIWFETIYLPFVMGSIIAMVKYIQTGKMYYITTCGAMVSLGFLTKQSTIWFIIIFIIFLLIYFRHYKDLGIKVLLIITPVLLGYVLSWLVFAVYSDGASYIYWTLEFLTRIPLYKSYYYLFPTWSDVLFVLPVFLVPCFTIVLFPSFTKQDKTVWILLVGLTLAAFMSTMPRWGIFHLQPALAISALFLGFITDAYVYRYVRRILMVIGLVILLYSTVNLTKYYLVIEPQTNPIPFEKIRERVRTINRIANGNSFYIFGNYDYIYYFNGIKPLMRPWVQMFPWMMEENQTQMQLLHALEREHIMYIFLFPFQGKFYNDYYPKQLYDYLEANYSIMDTSAFHDGVVYIRNK